MSQDVRSYFEEKVIPLVAGRYPEVMPEMIIRVDGSAGLGLQDEWSDLDAFIYLPRDLWRTHGGQLQLSLVHDLPAFSPRSVPHCECPGDPFSWSVYGHPEVNVHPWDELLCGRAEAVLAGQEEVPWEQVSIEELFELQEDLVLTDPRGVHARLREAAAPQRYPEPLWQKHLIGELAALKGEPWDLEKAALRGKGLEAAMTLGPLLIGLLHAGFLINRQYYPYRKYLDRYFRKLPGAAQGAGPHLDVIASAADWVDKAAAVNRIIRILTQEALDRGALSTEMFEYLLDARSGKAWLDPGWLNASEARREQAREAGYDPLDGWIWGWWGWE